MKGEVYNNAVDNLNQCMKRTALATKCSESTVRLIVKGSKRSEFLTVFQTPGKNKRIKPITDTVIHNFHVTEKK